MSGFKKQAIVFISSFFLLTSTTFAASPSYGQSGVNRVYPTTKVSSPKPTKPDTNANNTTKAERVKAVVDKILAKYQDRIDTYELFLNKVQLRRDKLADAGKDVRAVDRFLTTSQENLDSAKSTLASAKTILATTDYTMSMRAIRTIVSEQSQIVREALTTLHSSMSQSVAAARSATVSE